MRRELVSPLQGSCVWVGDSPGRCSGLTYDAPLGLKSVTLFGGAGVDTAMLDDLLDSRAQVEVLG